MADTKPQGLDRLIVQLREQQAKAPAGAPTPGQAAAVNRALKGFLDLIPRHAPSLVSEHAAHNAERLEIGRRALEHQPIHRPALATPAGSEQSAQLSFMSLLAPIKEANIALVEIKERVARIEANMAPAPPVACPPPAEIWASLQDAPLHIGIGAKFTWWLDRHPLKQLEAIKAEPLALRFIELGGAGNTDTLRKLVPAYLIRRRLSEAL